MQSAENRFMENDPREYLDEEESEANRIASLVFMDRFHFDSLSKHMKPFYAALVRHENALEEEKTEVGRKVCRGFYQRVREYRGLTVDRLAEICRVTSEDIKALERGDKEHEKWLIYRFVRACGAHLEYEVFVQKLLEFKDPRARAGAREVAKPLLQKWGMLIPGIDYKSLNSEMGKVMPLFSQKKENVAAPSELLPPHR